MRRFLLIIVFVLTCFAGYGYTLEDISDSLYHMHLRTKIGNYDIYKEQCKKYHQLRTMRGIASLYQDMIFEGDTICILEVYDPISESEGHTEVWNYGEYPLFFSYLGSGVGYREKDAVGYVSIIYNEYDPLAFSVSPLGDSSLNIQDMCKLWDMEKLQAAWARRGLITHSYHYMLSRIILKNNNYYIDLIWIDSNGTSSRFFSNIQCQDDTLTLLTADSVKYWDFDKGEGGVMFRSDSCFIEYDLDRCCVPPCINSPFLKKFSFIDGCLAIPVYDHPYKVLTIDEKNLVLLSKEDTLCLHKSEDQKTAVQTLPEIRYGYVAAKPIDIEEFQTNTLIPFIKDEMREHSSFVGLEELCFVAEFRIKKDGIIESVRVIKSNFNLQQNTIFESHLVEVLKKIRFTPAKNEYTGEFFDTTVSYSQKVILEELK